MKQWVKLYTEALHDRKLRKLSERDQLVFFKLVLLAGQEDKNGDLPCCEDIALELYMKEADVKKSVSNLISIGLLSESDNGNLYVTKFVARQETNLTGAERTARCRHNKRDIEDVTNERYNSNADVTEQRYTCNAEVTDERYECNEKVTLEKNRKEIEENRKDKDLEKNKEKEKIGVAKATSAHPKKSRGELKPYGIGENVLLSDEEYHQLQEKLGTKAADEQIEELSLYMGKSDKNAKKYTNHYFAVLSWSRNSVERTDHSSQATLFAKPKERTFADIRRDMETQQAVEDNTIESFWRD